MSVSFPKKSPFGANCQFGPNLAENHATLYVMIRRRIFLKHYHDGTQYVDKSNISQFSPI